MVIDNGGRMDEGCIGDLTALEAKACGLGGIVVSEAHRDSDELRKIGFPFFSYGSCPAGPTRLDYRDPTALSSVQFGNCTVTKDDFVFGDSDGVIFVEGSRTADLLSSASAIWERERKQAQAL